MTDEADKPADAGSWWHTTESGRKIGYMWPEDFHAIVDSIWGYRKGVTGFAKWTGMHRDTIARYALGTVAIPKSVAVLVLTAEKMVIQLKDKRAMHTGPKYLPEPDAHWLPGVDHTKTLDLPPFDGYA